RWFAALSTAVPSGCALSVGTGVCVTAVAGIGTPGLVSAVVGANGIGWMFSHRNHAAAARQANTNTAMGARIEFLRVAVASHRTRKARGCCCLRLLPTAQQSSRR